MQRTNTRLEGACESRSESVRFIITVSREGLDERRNAGQRNEFWEQTKEEDAISESAYKTDGDNRLFLAQLLVLNAISVKQIKLTDES